MDVGSLFSVEGKVALVTGGSRGIGAMAAEALVRSGCRVYISARKAAACRETADSLGEHGICVAIPADVGDADSRAALVEQLAAAEDHLDILVNNAGATWAAPLDQFPLSGWDKVLDVNLVGLFELTRLALPLLRAAATAEAPSRVINIGSLSGLRVPSLDTYPYAASKAGVHMLTRHLARRLGGEHITVNAVAPGPFPTRMMAGVLEEHGTEIAAGIPLGRIGEPLDVAGIVLFLASRAGAYLTGTTVPLDGGQSA
jgi:NAD(P)-dependent dehydrogenase (short-subunit alcohol dehydrogenase family)